MRLCISDHVKRSEREESHVPSRGQPASERRTAGEERRASGRRIGTGDAPRSGGGGWGTGEYRDSTRRRVPGLGSEGSTGTRLGGEYRGLGGSGGYRRLGGVSSGGQWGGSAQENSEVGSNSFSFPPGRRSRCCCCQNSPLSQPARPLRNIIRK
ncbi:hypothetical protein NHX12_003392 [Muraenolepis orangiensis]|uniref:Uncharacterized protein n=1 Tax=Muraenolepis orangiensis TaxID=630683 RepID=A0A9Q0DYB4_9TELE|nr:hypothetical protein NHX12_003392 [Muraenolepis orangiensis]